jgi:hypothetical protein
MIEMITPLRTDPFNTAKFGLGAYKAMLLNLVSCYHPIVLYYCVVYGNFNI